jgi:phosphomannomutase
LAEPDPTFPTVPFPNPEEGKSALNLAMATVERYNKDNADDIESGVKGKAIHILANDPDADRLAVAEYSERLNFCRFDANQIQILCLTTASCAYSGRYDLFFIGAALGVVPSCRLIKFMLKLNSTAAKTGKKQA